jgi:hypothetical protein
LLEDGNVLYRKNRLKEAAHRYQYALKKFPAEELGEHAATFKQLRVNFLLNQSRCKRKMNVSSFDQYINGENALVLSEQKTGFHVVCSVDRASWYNLCK